MNEARRASIHIIPWDDGRIDDVLGSLEEQEWRDFQTVLLRNGQPSSAALPKEVIELRHGKPLGFSVAHNHAISLALSRWAGQNLEDRYVIVLRPDVILSPKCLARLMRAMESQPTVAVVGPKVLRASFIWSDDGETRELAFSDAVDCVGYSLSKGRRIERGDSFDVFGVSSACLVMRASALERVRTVSGYFDPALHEASAVVDLLWRFRRAGFGSTLVAEAVVWREAPEGARALSPEPLSELDWPLLVFKNERLTDFFLHAPYLMAEWIRFHARVLIAPKFWAAYFKMVLRIPGALRQRWS